VHLTRRAVSDQLSAISYQLSASRDRWGSLRSTDPTATRVPSWFARPWQAAGAVVSWEVKERGYYDDPFIRGSRAARPLVAGERPSRLRRGGERRSPAAPPGARGAGQAGRAAKGHRAGHRAGRSGRAGALRSACDPGSHSRPAGRGYGASLMAVVPRSELAEA